MEIIDDIVNEIIRKIQTDKCRWSDVFSRVTVCITKGVPHHVVTQINNKWFIRPTYRQMLIAKMAKFGYLIDKMECSCDMINIVEMRVL